MMRAKIKCFRSVEGSAVSSFPTGRRICEVQIHDCACFRLAPPVTIAFGLHDPSTSRMVPPIRPFYCLIQLPYRQPRSVLEFLVYKWKPKSRTQPVSTTADLLRLCAHALAESICPSAPLTHHPQVFLSLSTLYISAEPFMGT